MATEKKTDIRKVKEIARLLLMTDVHTTVYSPMIVQHPFTSSGVTVLPETGKFVDITKSAENLKAWQDSIGKRIAAADSVYSIYMLINKIYTLTFLKYVQDLLSTEDMSTILADAWVRSECPNMDVDVNKTELVGMFERADKAHLMTKEERKLLSELGDILTVYRGVTAYNAKNIRALSWTIDRKKAEWFAHRFGESGTVYTAQIKKSDVLAVFLCRGESEIVVNPKKLMRIEKAEA